MLVLSRRPGEAIVFPVINTQVRVVGVKGGSVRLGIEAPAAMSVYREEVWREMQDRAARGETALPEVNPSAAACAEVNVAKEMNQLVRHRLHSATVSMAQARQQLREGQGDQASGTLSRVQEDFDLLLRQLEEVRAEFTANGPEKPLSQPLPRQRGPFPPRQPRSAAKLDSQLAVANR